VFPPTLAAYPADPVPANSPRRSTAGATQNPACLSSALTDFDCCDALTASIESFGDNPNYWCGANIGNNNCH
jgi:hypothetical protein